jgi:hypothetical protein
MLTVCFCKFYDNFFQALRLFGGDLLIIFLGICFHQSAISELILLTTQEIVLLEEK